MSDVRKTNLIMYSLFAGVLALSVSCTTVGQFKPVSQDVCDKIAYYDSYIETAQRAMFVLQFIPGTAVYIGAASSALVLADGFLDDAKVICDLAVRGDPGQLKALLDSVYNEIQRFNAAYGLAKATVRGGQQ
jgi:hypothetical protein